MNDRGPVSEADIARRARFVAIVIAATIVVWMLASLAGGQLGIPGRYAFYIDAAALAALAWAMYAISGIRKDRRALRKD